MTDFVSRGGPTAYRTYRAYKGVFGPPISRDIGARLDHGLQQRYNNHASQEKKAVQAHRSLHPHIDLHQLEPLTSGLGLLHLDIVISALPLLGLVLTEIPM